MLLDKMTTFNLLYDFYRPLLNEKQREVMELYYIEDWSLAEIAEHFSITRQAVHDRIKRVEKELTIYEAALKLLEKHEKRKKLVAKVTQQLSDYRHFEEVKPILDRLLEID